MKLSTKGRRYDTLFFGNHDGSWTSNDGFVLGRRGMQWEMIPSMSLQNDRMNFSVEGTTEYSAGFRRALREIVQQYPEVREFVFKFDGPWKTLDEVLSSEPVFFHGTSSSVLERILAEGLRPRSETGSAAAYGRSSSAREGSAGAVYLTNQRQMASYAARDAANALGGKPVILEITGIDMGKALPDEDSGAATAQQSLDTMGSMAYAGRITPSMIKGYHV